jgi:hypothetical protein
MAQIGLLRLKRLIVALVEFVKADYLLCVAEERTSESLLYRYFDVDDKDGMIDYRTSAIDLFTRSDKDSRKIDVRTMYDMDRASLPTIHIREASKTKGKQDGIGYIDDPYENESGTFTDVHRRSFESQYEIWLTSGNRHEVLIMEEVLLGLLIGAQDTLALTEPFYNFNFNSRELILNREGDSTPQLFCKSIGVNVSYDKKYPSLTSNTLLSKILFNMQLISDEEMPDPSFAVEDPDTGILVLYNDPSFMGYNFSLIDGELVLDIGETSVVHDFEGKTVDSLITVRYRDPEYQGSDFQIIDGKIYLIR